MRQVVKKLRIFEMAMALVVVAFGFGMQGVVVQDQAFAQSDTFNIMETTIADIHHHVKAGNLTFRQLVQMYLDRIEAYDQRTGLNAFVVLNPKAFNRADELDAEFQRTGQLRPLHGIPAVVKDNYDTHDLQTAGGSLWLSKTRFHLTMRSRSRNFAKRGRLFWVRPTWRNWPSALTSRSVQLMALPETRMT